MGGRLGADPPPFHISGTQGDGWGRGGQQQQQQQQTAGHTQVPSNHAPRGLHNPLYRHSDMDILEFFVFDCGARGDM